LTFELNKIINCGCVLALWMKMLQSKGLCRTSQTTLLGRNLQSRA